MFKSILGWFVSWQYQIAIIGILLLGTGIVSYVKGAQHAEVRCAVNTSKAIIESEKSHAKVEKKVKSVSDADLDKRLSRWVQL